MIGVVRALRCVESAATEPAAPMGVEKSGDQQPPVDKKCPVRIARGKVTGRTRLHREHTSFDHERGCKTATVKLQLRRRPKLTTLLGQGDVRLFPFRRAVPVIASAAQPSIYPREGSPTSFRSRSCSNSLEDLRRQRMRRGQIGGRAAAEPWIASLRSQ
jgi:hypothetical protein